MTKGVKMKQYYVIYSEQETAREETPMYWSNEHGWITLDMATVFTKDEIAELNLPMKGDWIKLPQFERKQK